MIFAVRISLQKVDIFAKKFHHENVIVIGLRATNIVVETC